MSRNCSGLLNISLTLSGNFSGTKNRSHAATMHSARSIRLLATASEPLLWDKLFLCLKGAAVSRCLWPASDWAAGLPGTFWRQLQRAHSPASQSEIAFLHHREHRMLQGSLERKNQWVRWKIISDHCSASAVPLFYKIFCFKMGCLTIQGLFLCLLKQGTGPNVTDYFDFCGSSC